MVRAGKSSRGVAAGPEPLPAAEILGFAGVLIAVALVHFFRDPANYLLPPLSYEDGRDFFAFYYNHRAPGSILRFYAGYVSLIPNLVGYGSMFLPIRWVPWVLAGVPGCLVSLACALPYLTFRAWMAPLWRLGTCLTLALLPVANRLFLSSTAYSIWPLLLLLVWGSLAPSPVSPRGAFLRLVPMAALIGSHPLSIALAPIHGLRAAACWKRRASEGSTGWLYALGLLLSTLAYPIFWVERAGLDPPGLGASIGRTAVFTVERVVFGTVFGDVALDGLHRARAAGWIYLGAAAILAGIAAILLRHHRRLGRSRLALLAALGWLILSFTGLYVVTRSPELRILTTGAALRYFWVQRLLFWTVLAVLANAVLAPTRDGGRGPGRVARVALVWGLFLWISVLNDLNNDRYRCPRKEGRRLEAFVAEVVHRESEGAADVSATLRRRGPWSIELGEGGLQEERHDRP